jgi:hypothetical protein
MLTDVDALTRELLEKLKNRNAEIRKEITVNLETIVVLERRLHLEPSQASPVPVIGPITEGAAKGSDSTGPVYQRNVFFGLTQKGAVIKLLRMTGQPMKIRAMLSILEGSGYHFKAQNPYRILWRTLSDADEIKKQGSLFGLKEWRQNGNAQAAPYQMPADDAVDFRDSNDTSESGEIATKE